MVAVAHDELGGTQSLQPSRSPEWLRIALWAGLGAGVLLVGGMAWRLSGTAGN